MKILLINPHSRFWLFPPLGLAYIASYARTQKHEVKIIDMVAEKININDVILDFAPNVIGITCTSQTFTSALNVAREAKKVNPSIKIVFGGSHSSAMPDMTLEHDEVDAVITGEADVDFVKVCNWLMEGRKKIKHDAGIINDINQLPWPSRDLLPMTRYDNPGTILTSRGCPHRCCYCAHHVSGYTWRGRKPKDVVNEIVYLRTHYSTDIHIVDDNFSMDINRAKEIMCLVADKNIKANFWFYNGLRADRVDDELIRLMKEAGTNLISFGLESIDADVLKNIEKRVTLEKVEEAIKLVHDNGIQVRVSMMIGNPGDTFGTAMESIRWARDNPYVDSVEFSLCTAYPGTPLWDWVEKNGRPLVDLENYPTYFLDDDIQPSFDTSDFSAEDRVKALKIAQKAMYRKFAFKGKSIRNFRISRIPIYTSTMKNLVFNRTPKKVFKKR